MDWTYRPGDAEVLVALHEPPGLLRVPALACVTWRGDEHLIPWAPGAYFDKAFCNLRNDRDGADGLLARAVGFVDTIDEQQTETLLASASTIDRVGIPAKDGLVVPAAELTDDAPGKAFASVRAKLVTANHVLGATTHFKPMLRGQNPTIGELGFWAIWDWSVLCLLDAQEFDPLAQMLNAFVYQLNVYVESGVPRMTEMGSVPLLAATAVASEG